MSDTSARASRRAFWFGSFARNGLIGLRCTTAGGGVGVDGVEKAAATLPPAAKAGGVGEPFAGGDGGSGIAVRIGGVSGAPNDADLVTAGFDSALGGGPCSRGTDGTLRGENGGVRGRGGGAGGSARFGVGGAVLGGGA